MPCVANADPGLAMTSTAPSASARTAVSLLRGVSELTTTTGSGKWRMSFARKLRPSMRGISMSSVTTSGRSRTIFSRATYGSIAVPTTSMSGCCPSSSLRILRTSAESSTIEHADHGVERTAGSPRRATGRGAAHQDSVGEAELGRRIDAERELRATVLDPERDGEAARRRMRQGDAGIARIRRALGRRGQVEHGLATRDQREHVAADDVGELADRVALHLTVRTDGGGRKPSMLAASAIATSSLTATSSVPVQGPANATRTVNVRGASACTALGVVVGEQQGERLKSRSRCRQQRGRHSTRHRG